MLAFTRQHSPYTEIIYILGGKRELKREWSPTAGGRALHQTRAEKTDDHITLPLATIKTAARTRFPGMYDIPVTKHMEQSFGNALMANCTFGNVSWQCSLFKLCQSSSKCDNVIRRSCQGIRLSVAFGDFRKESNTGGNLVCSSSIQLPYQISSPIFEVLVHPLPLEEPVTLRLTLLLVPVSSPQLTTRR